MMKIVSNMARLMRRQLKQLFISSMESTSTDNKLPTSPTVATTTWKMSMTLFTMNTSSTPSSRKEQDDADMLGMVRLGLRGREAQLGLRGDNNGVRMVTFC